MTSRLRPGVRAIDRLMKANPGTSVARMTPEQLARAQTMVIPDRGPASLLFGRLQRGVEVRKAKFPARHGELVDELQRGPADSSTGVDEGGVSHLAPTMRLPAGSRRVSTDPRRRDCDYRATAAR